MNGTLPKPSYGVQAAGKVVVEIWVDNYGNVQKAVAGVEAHSVADSPKLTAAQKSAITFIVFISAFEKAINQSNGITRRAAP